jgi:serine protease Do
LQSFKNIRVDDFFCNFLDKRFCFFFLKLEQIFIFQRSQYSQKSEDSHKKSFEYFPFDYLNELLERFNLPFNFDEMYSNPKSVPLGSGFIIDPAGFIVTNHHVVANADEIHVKLTDNREMSAKLVGSDQKTDLALLKIEAENPLPFAKFGDSGKARVGDWVIAIGTFW